MKKIFVLIVSIFIIALLASCNSGDATTEHTGNNSDISNSNNYAGVTKEHMDFILNRKVFVSDFADMYNSTIPNYDSVFDCEMTFADLFSSKYFAENLCEWEYLSKEDGLYIVSFSGMAKSISGDNIPIVVGFCFTDKAQMPVIFHFVFGSDKNGTTNEWSVEIIKNQYGYDEATSMCMCDALFSCMLASALIEIDPEPSYEERIYNEGVIAEENCEYLLAIEKYSAVGLYMDAQDRIIICKYLYAESEYTNGNYITAINFYQEIISHNDAAEKIKSSYYLLGKDYLINEKYLEAAVCFQNAEDYNDSQDMLYECYYQHGKLQLAANNTADAEKYLSMCRGYKDTDDILLSHYYSQALKAYNDFLVDLKQYGQHSASYENARWRLLLCEGYKDSTTMMRVIENLYNAVTNISYLSSWEADLNGVNVSANGNDIFLSKFDFSGNGENLTLSTNVIDKTFDAEIIHIFAPNMRNYGEVKIIEALVILFSDISNIDELSQEISNETMWSIDDNGEEFIKAVDGYSITIRVVEESWGYINCYITVSTV